MAWQSPKRAVVWAAASLLVLALAACGSSTHVSRATSHAPISVTTEPISTAGAGRFTVPIGTDLQGLERRYGDLSSAAGNPTTYRGDRAGLYAAARGRPSCDASALASSLEANPTEAAAWASTVGIAPSQIHSYMASLTPVVLRVDTRVTNHGWTSGSVTRFQAVLQAGTSVLVDQHGMPVTKCYCGNPLSAPRMSSKASFTGPQWSGFSERRLALIEPSANAIRVFTLFDPVSAGTFQRTAGSHIAPAGLPASGTSTTSSSSTTVQTAVPSAPAAQTSSTTEPNVATGTSGTTAP